MKALYTSNLMKLIVFMLGDNVI